MEQNARINRWVAIGIFLVSWVTYLRTIAPTTSFWDCGEFIACSYIMGVMHPPGAPLYELLGRLFTFIPFGDVGWRVNLISTIASAATVMLLYLIIVRMVRQFRGEPRTAHDRWITYGGAAIGALAYAFSDSFWFNAVEAEVYALSMFLTSLAVWLILYWADHAQDLRYEKIIFFIAYLFGLATGVHLLSLLVFPFILLIVAFQNNATLRRLGIVIALQIAVPLALYILIFHYNPNTMSYTEFMNHQRRAFNFLKIFGAIFVGATLIYLFYTDRRAFRIWWIFPVLLLIGYTTYMVIYIRSGLDPPIDLNNPENFKNLTKYLARKQYGEHSLLLTMFARKAEFWAYQIKKMYIRYFGWQFIGKGNTYGPDEYIVETISLRGLLGIPFLVGIWGMIQHFSRDWKRALAVLVLFIATGIAIILYLNQENPQPRERDYAYVGSFFAFAIWIGIGAVALLEGIADILRRRALPARAGVLGVLALLFVAVPFNTFRFNFDSHDRSGNYVPYDYSYNILQTCEPNAIIFTNGDNDTFPLWFLQYVYGIRQDVRLINLSLLNTSWYIKQLKHEEPKVPISLSDEEIENIGIYPWPKKQKIRIPVPDWAYERELEDLKARGELTGKEEKTGEIVFELAPTLGGRALRVQDLMILNILYTNNWKRPIYFAVTVSPENMIGLNDYLRMDGMAFKLVPFPKQGLSPSRLHKNLFEVFQFRGLNDPSVYLDEKTQALLINYRSAFIRLAAHYLKKGQKEKAAEVLDRMSQVIPEEVRPLKDLQVVLSIAQMYYQVGRIKEYEKRLRRLVEQHPNIPQLKFQLADFYQRHGQYREALVLLDELIRLYPQDKNLRKYVDFVRRAAGKDTAQPPKGEKGVPIQPQGK